MKKTILKIIVLMILTGLILSGCSGGQAQSSAAPGSSKAASAAAEYPSRPVSIICGMSAGGDTDFNARTTARYLEQFLGQSFPVTNNTGNGGADASNQLMKSEPDGYTLGFMTSTVSSNRASGITNFSLTDFDIIAVAGKSPGEALVVQYDAPYRNVQEFVQYTIAHPFEVNWAANVGATSHFAGVIANNVYGAKLNLVSTGSTTQRVAALMGGNVDAICVPAKAVADYVETKEAKYLCMLTSERVWYLPDLETAVDAGFPKFFYDNAYYLCAPKGTDPAIIEKLADACEKMSKTPSYETDIKNAFSQWLFFLRGEEAIQFAIKEQERYMEFSQYYKK